MKRIKIHSPVTDMFIKWWYGNAKQTSRKYQFKYHDFTMHLLEKRRIGVGNPTHKKICECCNYLIRWHSIVFLS